MVLANAEPFDYLRNHIEQRSLGHTSGFEHQNIKERLYSEETLEDPKSIIAIALAYPNQNSRKSSPWWKTGNLLAHRGVGTDLSLHLEERLKKLIAFIKEQAEWNRFKLRRRFVYRSIQVNWWMLSRATSGSGFYRAQRPVDCWWRIWMTRGSWNNQYSPEPDQPVSNGCGDCGPSPGYRLSNRCLIRETVGWMRKMPLIKHKPKAWCQSNIERKMRNVIYGCDIRQFVRPYNRGKDFHFHEEMEPKSRWGSYPKPAPLLSIHREFKEHLTLSRLLARKNCCSAMYWSPWANLGGKEALQKLKLVYRTSGQSFAATAVWASRSVDKKQTWGNDWGLLQDLEKPKPTRESLTEIIMFWKGLVEDKDRTRIEKCSVFCFEVL